MSENNVNGITGADVATTTGIIGATIAIGQYIVNDYVITIAEAEGDYGYTMTITRGTETQTVTLYGLTEEQYDAMLGYLQQAQEAAQSAQTADRDAQAALSRALNAALAAADSESNAAEHASESLEQAGFALQSANDARAASIAAQSAQQQAQAAQTAAETAKTSAQTAQAAAEAARIAAETAETSAGTSASQASQSATNAAQSATDAQHVLDSIPEDYTEVASDVADLKSQIMDEETVYPFDNQAMWGRYTIGTSTTLAFEPSTTRIAVNPPVDIETLNAQFVVTPLTGYKFVFAFYDSSSKQKMKTDWQTSAATYSIPEGSKYVTMLIAKTDNSTITTDDYDKVDVVYTHVVNRLNAIESEIDELDANVDNLSDVVGTLDELPQKVHSLSEDIRLHTLVDDGNLIPLDQYTPVKYIEANTGDMYGVRVNTGLALGPALRTELDMELTDISSSANYMGREGVNNKYIRNSIGFNPSISSTAFYFGFGNENLSLGTADTKRHIFYIDVPKLKYGVDNIEGDKSTFTYGSNYSSTPIYLFGTHAQSINAKSKLYTAKFYSNDVLIAYFVPVVRVSDGRAGFYDIIRQEFYTNGGSGTLMAGPSSISTNEPNIPSKKTAITDDYAARFGNDSQVDGFVFLTDPHIYNANVTEEAQQSLFESLLSAYASTPARFVLSGGDWLQGGAQDVIPGGPSTAQACGQLGYVTGVMEHLFKMYYPVFGNHDGNYKNTALPRQAVINLMFSEQNRCYYQFKAGNTRYYIFDTTTDVGLNSRTDYKREQQNWFVDQLLSNTDDTDIVIGCHIFTNNYTSTASDDDICIQMRDILSVAEAYNSRNASYTLPWVSEIKDFSACSGTVHYCIAGHTHHDLLGEYAGIPVLITQNALHNYVQPTFDLVAYDYDADTVYTNRVGNGSNRILHCGRVIVETTVVLTPVISGALSWSSLDDTVATVSNGTITAVSSGYALISATNGNGEMEAWVVHVE